MNSNTVLHVTIITLTLLTLDAARTQAQWHKTAKQVANFDSLPDSTDKLQTLIEKQKGVVVLTEKFYRISRPLTLQLGKHGAASITSTSGSTLIMTGPGPAISVLGNHTGTASPKSFSPNTWNERMPTFS